MKWKFIVLSLVIFFSGCAKNVADKNNDLGNGNKSNLPVSLDALIEHAERIASRQATVEKTSNKLTKKFKF